MTESISSNSHSFDKRLTINSTSGSVNSRRSKCPVYRTKSRLSEIDENLFGKLTKQTNKNNSNSFQCNEEEINVFRPTNDVTNCPKKIVHNRIKKLKVFSQDLVEHKIIPDDKIKDKSILLPKSKYNRLKEMAKMISITEQKELDSDFKARKEKELAESQVRKLEMKKMDMARRVNEKLNDLEEEELLKAHFLVKSAMEQRQEQEDEIKKLNELILNAKVQAIRDAQILEKEQINKEYEEEELRLDNMMEVSRQNALHVQEEINKKRKEEELKGACEILKQIGANEQERLLELERQEQENIDARRKMAAAMMEDISRRTEKRRTQDRLREELNKANDQMIQQKKTEKEHEMLFDMKILKIQHEKAQREAAYEAEQARVRMEKELEIARLRAVQERARDEQAERDALRAKRAAEEAERQWRKKEMDAAKQKADTEAELKKARALQSEERKRLFAMEADRERCEFERILRAQKEMIERDKEEAEKKNSLLNGYKNEIRRQICEKEQERIAERNAFFEEGVRMEEEARLRRLRMQDAKIRKMQELREAGIPEKYLSQIERKAKETTSTGA